MDKICDLHTHSVFSDGTYTPEELIDSAIAIGLSAIALTDHNTADGLPTFLRAAKGKPIEAVAGVEFSVDLDGTELHLLGLFIDEKHFSPINELMLDYVRRKEDSNIDLVDALARDGVIIEYDKLKSATPNGKVNRAHIASEMVALGYTASVQDSFKRYLAPSCGYYREPRRPTAFEMIEYIRSIEAVPVLAHPFLNLDEAKLSDFLPRAKSAGLCGMECIYTKNDEKTTALSFALADRFGLLPSGGSDFHGKNKPDTHLATGRGNLKIPYEYFLTLRSQK